MNVLVYILRKTLAPLFELLLTRVGGVFKISYSQEGEDLILARIFESTSKGFYIDIGAHHPQTYSNTYYFYKRGWSGVNIDATPGSMAAFRCRRPRDINLEVAIGGDNKPVNFYCFDEPAYNSFDTKLVEQRMKMGAKLKKKFELQQKTLAEVLDNLDSVPSHIDFMSIDVEGSDLEVLKSNNWKRFRPKILVVECLESSLEMISDSEVGKYLSTLQYEVFAKAFNTVFFIDRQPM